MGQTMVVLPRFDINLVLDTVAKYVNDFDNSFMYRTNRSCRYRLEMLALAPSMLHQLLNSPRLATADISSVKNIGCGGAYLPPALSRQVRTLLKSKTPMTEGTVEYFDYAATPDPA